MSDYTTNKIELKPIKDLLIFNYKNESIYQFSVPSYQRGYKWGKSEVEYLLTDIWEFAENKGKPEHEIYCLQPIVVKKQGAEYELIDGQQRLTTIYLILSYLNLKCFDLKYKTRDKSERFLKELSSNKTFSEADKDENVDFWHICNAWECISNWMIEMKKKTDTFENDFQDCFLEKVKVIWYEVGEKTKSREIYSRLNVGKIPLTNAELIKALILSKEEKVYQKDKIALMWDRIETSLQNDKLWCFLNNTEDASYKLETRIDFLLDLLTNKSEEQKRDEREKYFSFKKFQAIHNTNASEDDKKYWKEQKIKSLNDAWSKVEDIFQTICDWFDDGKIYHYVGYYICFSLSPKGKHPVQFLVDTYRGTSKSEFIKTIKLRILENLNKDNYAFIKSLFEEINMLKTCSSSDKQLIDSKELELKLIIQSFLEQQDYDNTDRLLLRKILLLFNVLTVMQNQKKLEEKNGKHTLQTIGNIFPFDLFKKESGWDIEHVHSQTDKDIIKKEEQVDWLYNTFTDVENDTKHLIIETFALDRISTVMDEKLIRSEMVEIINNLLPANFEQNKIKLASIIESGISNKNSLFNLTLLDCRTNRSYQNALFPTKRKILLNRDKEGQFVPVCTKNLFQKYYTGQSVKISTWSDTDAEGYKSAMVNMFTNMITE